MGAPRSVAVRLLSVVVRLAPEESRAWAAAMLGELEFIEDDWAALFWALGSMGALARHAVSAIRLRILANMKREAVMNDSGKKAVGVGIGIVSALMLVGCAFATLRIIGVLFPSLGLDHAGWAYWLAVMAIPEAVFVIATVMLWRRRGPVAAGILATGLVMALHVAVHFAIR
jgi:hypothetical protein